MANPRRRKRYDTEEKKDDAKPKTTLKQRMQAKSEDFKKRYADKIAKRKKQSSEFNERYKERTEARRKKRGLAIKKKTEKPEKKTKATSSATPKKSKFGQGSKLTIQHKGREMANVTKEQLKASGLSLREYMNKWQRTGKRP